jgi:four helix bundle protein
VKENNPLLIKSFDFGVDASSYAKRVRDIHKEYDLFTQLSRASLSVGSNSEEAIGAESKKDFLHKLSIAYKETRESRYFLRVIVARELTIDNSHDLLISRAEELMRIIGSIQKTMKKRYGL